MNFKFKENNLDLLRLILASCVIFLHLKHLTGVPVLADIFAYLDFLSVNAVPAFFVVSGFLIFMSFDKSKSLSSYLMSRALRIYPAYIVLIFICIFVSILNVDSFSSDYIDDVASYFFSNIIFLNFLAPGLPGLFESNPITVVNGALWTLKVEVMFYITVPLIYILVKRYNSLGIMLLLYLLSHAYYTLLNNYDILPTYNQFLKHQLPAQVRYFSAGIVFYLYYDILMRYRRYLMLLTLATFSFEIELFFPFCLAFVVFYVFMYLPKFSDLSKVGDVSYGVYIYHFPVIQLFVQFGCFDESPFIASALVFAVTYVLAFLSWQLIEKKSLTLKHKIKWMQS